MGVKRFKKRPAVLRVTRVGIGRREDLICWSEADINYIYESGKYKNVEIIQEGN